MFTTPPYRPPARPPSRPPSATGQSEEELRDLAFLLFTAVAASGAGGITPQQAAGLTRVLAQQLCVEEARVADIQRVLRHIQPGVCGWVGGWCGWVGWCAGVRWWGGEAERL